MGTKHLHKRGKVYHFRMRVPKDLQKILGITELGKSLKSLSNLDATYCCAKLNRNFKTLFQQLRERKMDKDPRQLVSEIFNIALADFEEIRIIGQQEEKEDIDEFIANFPKNKLNKMLANNDVKCFNPLIDIFLQERGVLLSKTSIKYKTIQRELLKAFKEICQIENERSQGNYLNEYDKQQSYTLTARQATTPPAQQVNKRGGKLSILIEKYINEHIDMKRWGIKTTSDNKSYFCQRSVKMYHQWSNQNVPPLDRKML